MTLLINQEILKPDFEKIPPLLKAIPNWICWNSQERTAKDGSTYLSKEPVHLNSPEKFGYKWDSPAQLFNFNDVQKAYETGQFNGIGFVLFPDTPLTCVDFDNLPHFKTLDQLPAEIYNYSIHSYAEKSPSGTGIHLWIKGQKPNWVGTKENNVEFFGGQVKFLTMTGHRLNTLDIQDNQALINIIAEHFFTKKHTIQAPAATQINQSQFTGFKNAHKLTDSELLNEMFNSKRKNEIRSLWDGNISAQAGDDSAADFALAKHLLFWTSGNVERTYNLMWQSNLVRDKWTTHKNYLSITINNALRFLCEDQAKFNAQDQPIKPQVEALPTPIIEETPVELFLPDNYLQKGEALYQLKETQNGTEEKYICRQTPMIIGAYSNIEKIGKIHYEIEWKDNGRIHSDLVSKGSISISKEILNLAETTTLAINSNNSASLIQFFDQYVRINDIPRYELAERLGHVADKFIHPLISDDIKILPADSGEKQFLTAFEQRGSATDWINNVLHVVKEHPKALIVLLASFASVILKDLKVSPFVVDIAGQTSRGKTTLLKICASVWGAWDNDNRLSLVSEWNATKVSVERKAAFLNSFPLLMDDTRKAPNQNDVKSFVYNFSGGRGKGRGSVKGSQEESTWANILISTGEVSMNDYAEEMGGVAARIISINGNPFQHVDYNFFNNIYGAMEDNYGAIGIEFLNKWTKHKDSFIHNFSSYVKIYQEKAAGNDVVVRLARFYASLVFTADLLNNFFDAQIDLNSIDKLFTELNEENKAIDKPKQLLEMLLNDLDADRGAIFRGHPISKTIKAIYKDSKIYVTPAYLKEFLKLEEKQTRAEWLRRQYTTAKSGNKKIVDYSSIKLRGQACRAVEINPNIVAELDFDFSETNR